MVNETATEMKENFPENRGIERWIYRMKNVSW